MHSTQKSICAEKVNEWNFCAGRRKRRCRLPTQNMYSIKTEAAKGISAIHSLSLARLSITNEYFSIVVSASAIRWLWQRQAHKFHSPHSASHQVIVLHFFGENLSAVDADFGCACHCINIKRHFDCQISFRFIFVFVVSYHEYYINTMISQKNILMFFFLHREKTTARPSNLIEFLIHVRTLHSNLCRISIKWHLRESNIFRRNRNYLSKKYVPIFVSIVDNESNTNNEITRVIRSHKHIRQIKMSVYW